jgi:hypothetical protein
MVGNGTEFEPVTLGNVGEGELERQFSECVNSVVEAFDELQEYEPTSHQIKCKVQMTVEFTKNLETGAVLVGVRASYTPPKRRLALRAAFIKDGVVLVEDAEQLGLLDDPESNVRPISSAGTAIEEGE